MSRTPNQLLGYLVGGSYLLVGLLGFTVSGEHEFLGHQGGLLLGVFAVNGLHNVVHVLIGAALAGAAASSPAAARAVNTVVGTVYLVVGAAGLFLAPDSPLNLLALNSADNVLHLGSALLLLVVGLAGAQLKAPDSATTSP